MSIPVDIQSEVKVKISSIFRDEGMDLVEYRFLDSPKITIRCLADYPLGGITIDDCSRVNRKIFSYLEKSEILGDDFVVEVNSPGLNRLLRNTGDFIRCRGKNISVWLKDSINGKDYWEGKVSEVKDNILSLKLSDKILEVPFDIIKTAKLII